VITVLGMLLVYAYSIVASAKKRKLGVF